MAKRKRFSILGLALGCQFMAWWGLLIPWLGFRFQNNDYAAADHATVLTQEEYQKLADPRVRIVEFDFGRASLHKTDDPNWEKKHVCNYKPILHGAYYVDSRAYAEVDNEETFDRLFRVTFPFVTASLVCLMIFLRREMKKTQGKSNQGSELIGNPLRGSPNACP